MDFGALAPIYGTLVTSAIALLIGVPVSFGIALFLTEMCPVVLKRPLGTAVELLAAIPSIIYGMWGLFVFAPVFGDYVQPALTKVFGDLWILGPLFQRRAERHRRAVGGHHPVDHGDPVHRVGDARRVRDRAAGAQGIGLRHRRDDVGSGLERRAAVHQGRRDRRHHAGSRPRAGRDDGGDVRHRQRLPDQRVAVRAGQLDRLGARQRVQRSRRSGAPRVADRARPRAVPAHVHRARLLADAAGAARQGGGHEEHARRPLRGRAARKVEPCGVLCGVPQAAVRQPLEPRDVARDDGLRHDLPAVDPVGALRQRILGAVADAVHADDPAAGLGRRARQRDLRQRDHRAGGDVHQHADRHPRRHLPRRIRQGRLGRPPDALHQRHPAVGAVDRHRPLRLHGVRDAGRAFLRLGGLVRAGADRDSRGRAHHREHAASRAGQPARGGGGAGRADVEGDPAR